jgi:hypothetical protein
MCDSFVIGKRPAHRGRILLPLETGQQWARSKWPKKAAEIADEQRSEDVQRWTAKRRAGLGRCEHWRCGVLQFFRWIRAIGVIGLLSRAQRSNRGGGGGPRADVAV